jgi:hypothetical protein
VSINLVENYAVTQARQAVKDSLQAHGEACIVLQMYHTFSDSDEKPPCPYCTDDIYTGSGEPCTICWGTGLQDGIKQAIKVWALFTDNVEGEAFGKRGVWLADDREFQTEALPFLTEHDYVIRVRQWYPNHTPMEIEGFYGIKQMTRDSLRTGTRFGQSVVDIVGQRAQISRLSEATTIARYPVIGVHFDTLEPSITPPPIPLITPPNQITPVEAKLHAYTIGDGQSTTITINHGLGTTNLLVQLYDEETGEQLDTNILASTISSVTLNFQNPPAQDSLRVVIAI